MSFSLHKSGRIQSFGFDSTKSTQVKTIEMKSNSSVPNKGIMNRNVIYVNQSVNASIIYTMRMCEFRVNCVGNGDAVGHQYVIAAIIHIPSH